MSNLIESLIGIDWVEIPQDSAFQRFLQKYLLAERELRALLEDPTTPDETLRNLEGRTQNAEMLEKLILHPNISIETLLSMRTQYPLILKLRPDLPDWVRVEMSIGSI